MIDRTQMLFALPPTGPVERIDLELVLGDAFAARTYYPAKGMDLAACIAAIVDPKHGVLDPFACSRDWPHRVGNRGKFGSVRQTLMDGHWELMEVESATVHFADETSRAIPLIWFEIANAEAADGVPPIVLEATVTECSEDGRPTAMTLARSAADE